MPGRWEANPDDQLTTPTDNSTIIYRPSIRHTKRIIFSRYGCADSHKYISLSCKQHQTLDQVPTVAAHLLDVLLPNVYVNVWLHVFHGILNLQAA